MYGCTLIKNEEERKEEREGGRERERERERERGRNCYLGLPSPVVVINKRIPCLKKCCRSLKQL